MTNDKWQMIKYIFRININTYTFKFIKTSETWLTTCKKEEFIFFESGLFKSYVNGKCPVSSKEEVKSNESISLEEPNWPDFASVTD